MGSRNNSKGRNAHTSRQKQVGGQGVWARHQRLWKGLVWVVGGLCLLLLAVYIAFQISPWPNALLIRYGFDENDAKVAAALAKHVPKGIASLDNQQYHPHDKDGYLDVFYPEGTTKPLPAVVWVHGGAWVSGDKDDIDNYLKIIASYGYTAVGVDYTVAPEAQYPAPLLRLNDALAYIRQHAGQLHIDAHRMVLAGDSAGSQIVAQMATIVTSPTYAKEMRLQPALPSDNLKAMLLNCGAYDLTLPDYKGPFGGFLHTVLWAYSGKKDFLSDPDLKRASVVNYITSAFPPSFVTAGNADPLEPQSREMATRLSQLGVPASTLFFPADHQPALPHEYQFNLDIADGQQALDQMVKFLRQYTSN